MEKLTSEWFLLQSKHQVSASAANSFWDAAFKCVPPVLAARNKKVPQFVHQRRILIAEKCPKISMEYLYRNKEDNSIVTFKGTIAPVKKYQNPGKYEKLCEVAKVDVRI